MRIASPTALDAAARPIISPGVLRAPSPPRATPIPSPQLPGIPPRHPALPAPPTLDALGMLAERAPVAQRFVPGSHPSTIRNAHYANTRSQLAYALTGPYNSVEGDVRVRDGRIVMQHDARGAADLTFEQWATIASRAGKHLRIDVKEPEALAHVTRQLAQIGVPAGSVTFNVGIRTRWSAGSSIETIRALRAEWPASWITLNLPLPFAPGYVLASQAARMIGRERLGVAVMAGLVRREDVEQLRRSFDAVNAWNIPQLRVDVDREAIRLRSIGVNGMLDLRRREDPLASD